MSVDLCRFESALIASDVHVVKRKVLLEFLPSLELRKLPFVEGPSIIAIFQIVQPFTGAPIQGSLQIDRLVGVFEVCAC